jgi:diaminobutyrate-2-oxoglutarate transaminase
MTIGTENDITEQTENTDVDTSTFDELESEVQSYARNFPVIFDRAVGVHLYDQNGDEYLDFLAGAGSLNYGHNNPVLKEKLIEYIQYDGITHGLDFHTSAKERFLDALSELIFQPRDMNYVVQFTGPTGSNSVEAALKIARKVKGRHNVIAFTNGFHGVSVGAMATTGNSHHRDASGVPLIGASFMPYDGYFGDGVDTTEYLDKMLSDPSSGIDHPAAAIVETVQGEGGLNAASFEWLRKLERVCRKHDMLLILDDIQAGCGRTGTFFSFDNAGISPDIITMSKSLSGFGLPFAVTMIKPEYDQWKPGEHNGTFRGNNHAFVTATTALRHYWSDDKFAKDVQRKGDLMMKRLDGIAGKYSADLVKSKGRGMMCGLEFATGELAKAVTEYAFDKKLVIETSGSEDQVVKCLMSIIIEDKDLIAGLDILEEATDKAIKDMRARADKAVA